MSYQIFISYRRDGGESLAALLYERFRQRGYRVFYDVESLRSGEFNKKLLSVIEECEDVLLVLPPGGLDRCIGNPDDWVRQEIEFALKLEKNVIPLMMRNFVFPDNLPEGMKELPNLNGISANMEFFDAVIDRISEKRLISRPADDADSEEHKMNALRKEAESGDAAACNELGMIYEQGSVNTVSNLKTALSWYQKGMELGSLAALYNVGEIYESCADDLTLVFEYGIDIGEETDADACRALLREQADRCYEKAAAEEYAPALYKLGTRMEEQLRLPDAHEYYKRAAKQKYNPAINALAWTYRNGIGAEENLLLAEEFYRQAAEAGYAPAIYNYANTIEMRDPQTAMQLYAKVAYGENAIPMAAYALGRRYEYTMQDLRSAVSCYELALEGGVAGAADDLDRCRGMLVVS